MTTDLDPIAILQYKAQDLSLTSPAQVLLHNAAAHLEMQDWWAEYESALDTLT